MKLVSERQLELAGRQLKLEKELSLLLQQIKKNTSLIIGDDELFHEINKLLTPFGIDVTVVFQKPKKRSNEYITDLKTIIFNYLTEHKKLTGVNSGIIVNAPHNRCYYKKRYYDRMKYVPKFRELSNLFYQQINK